MHPCNLAKDDLRHSLTPRKTVQQRLGPSPKKRTRPEVTVQQQPAQVPVRTRPARLPTQTPAKPKPQSILPTPPASQPKTPRRPRKPRAIAQTPATPGTTGAAMCSRCGQTNHDIDNCYACHDIEGNDLTEDDPGGNFMIMRVVEHNYDADDKNAEYTAQDFLQSWE